MLELTKVTKHYGALSAVREVSFRARPGEILGYLGPNGSGKSTTVQIVAGLLTPTRGSVTFDGHDIFESASSLFEHRRRIGYVPETPHLYSYLTGPEYLALVGRLRNIPEGLLQHKVDSFLELFGLGPSRYSPLSAYSKGMKQKILIVAALLHNPDLVILDEPSSGLDVSATLVLRELIRALADDGKVVLYSSHVLEHVEQVCSSVVILRQGEVVARDSVARLRDLMEKPSLEEVFTKLAVREDAREIAQRIAETMRLGAAP